MVAWQPNLDVRVFDRDWQQRQFEVGDRLSDPLPKAYCRDAELIRRRCLLNMTAMVGSF